jgi:methylthioribose-1-phosphate isomerase
LKALAAHDNGVPFYAAVPSSSIDWSCDEPAQIPIEERSGDEVRFVQGHTADGSPARVQVVGSTSNVANPAFDVTPRRLMTGLITERGIAEPTREGLAKLFPDASREAS